MTRRNRGLKLWLFILAPGLAAVAPLVVIPAITHTYGAVGWASVAIAMALGNAGAVVAELGWGVVGPQRVARESSGRLDTYRESLGSRLIGFAVVCPPLAVFSWLLAPAHGAAAVVLTIALVSNCLSPVWYYTGLGRPGIFLIVETLPRMLLSVAAAVLIFGGGPLEIYGTVLLASTVATYFLSAWFGSTPLSPSSFHTAIASIRKQGVIAFGRLVSTAYTSLPTAVLALVAPHAVAVFAGADRPLRMGLSVLGGIPARLQSWMGVREMDVRAHRARISILINFGVGVLAGCVYALLMPIAANILFSGKVSVGYPLSTLGGVLVVLICTSRGYGLALVAAGRANSITLATAWAAPIGIIGVLCLGFFFGAHGAVLGLIAAEIAGIAVQYSRVRRWLASGGKDT